MSRIALTLDPAPGDGAVENQHQWGGGVCIFQDYFYSTKYANQIWDKVPPPKSSQTDAQILGWA